MAPRTADAVRCLGAPVLAYPGFARARRAGGARAFVLRLPTGAAPLAVEEAVKILLVDDSQRLLRSLGQGLKKLGYAVDLAADGEQGLALAETYDYHVIVLDLMLPGLSGLEVLRRLRARGSGVHVLILSARDGWTIA